MDGKRLRGAGSETAVLHARRHDPALRLPPDGALRGPRLRRREVHDLGPGGEGADLGLAAVYRDGGDRLDPGLALEDARREARGRARRGELMVRVDTTLKKGELC